MPWNFILKLKSWRSYYLCFSKEVFFATGLVYSFKLVDYSVMVVFIVYLNDSSKEINLREAATIVNAKEGLSALLVIFMTYLSNKASFGRPKVIICSNISTITGLVHLYLTRLETVPVKVFILIGAILLAVGEAGVMASLETYLDYQLRNLEPKTEINEDRVAARRTVWWRGVWCLSVVTTLFLASNWRSTLIFCTSATMGGLLLFLCGVWFRHSRAATRRLLTTLQYRLIAVLAFQRLRCQDRTAIMESSHLIPEEESKAPDRAQPSTRKTKLKILLKMVPMWIAFLTIGLVLSTGDTYFSKQGDTMDSSDFYVLLFVLQNVSSRVTSFLSKLLLSKCVPETSRKQAKLVIIWAGMVLSIFCCAVSWQVEIERLIIVKNEGLLEIPEGLLANSERSKSLPMSIFWLAPQFCLLGLMEGLAREGLDQFLMDEFPVSWKGYVTAIIEFILGIGKLLSIVCTLYVNRSLFGTDLNHSRLDVYYHRLAILSTVNLCYYFCTVYYYQRRQ